MISHGNKRKIQFLNDATIERQELIKQSKTVQEVELLKKMLEYTIDVYGSDSNKTINILNELGGSAKYIGDYDLAINSLNKALDIIGKKFGSDCIAYATTTLNLTEVYRFKGDLDKLESLYLDIINIYEKYDMKLTYEYAAVCNNLGLYYQDINDFEKALKYHLISLEILKNTDEYMIALATTYNNLAVAYRQLGNIGKSDEYINICLKIYEKEVGLGHSMYSAAINNLAISFFQNGHIEKAKQLFEKALFICEASFGRGSVNYMKLKENIDMVYETIQRINNENN